MAVRSPYRNKQLTPPGRHQKSPISETNAVCEFCFDSCEDEAHCGKLLKKNGCTVHYYCMLLASGLSQNTKLTDKNGILGFLISDIQKELRRGKRLRCFYCRQVGATIGCCHKGCKKVFHLCCGRVNGSLHQFFDQFRSYCFDHAISQPNQKKHGHVSCTICFAGLNKAPEGEILYCPTCKKANFHRFCLQKYALSAGLHHFKCPLCNSAQDFVTEMMHFGIYIPDRDASWELEPNAFGELLERHDRCDAEICDCPKGRHYNTEKGDYELILCASCGAYGSHKACLSLRHNRKKPLLCPPCAEIEQETEKKRREAAKAKATPSRKSVGHQRKEQEIKKSDVLHSQASASQGEEIEVLVRPELCEDKRLLCWCYVPCVKIDAQMELKGNCVILGSSTASTSDEKSRFTQLKRKLPDDSRKELSVYENSSDVIMLGLSQFFKDYHVFLPEKLERLTKIVENVRLEKNVAKKMRQSINTTDIFDCDDEVQPVVKKMRKRIDSNLVQSIEEFKNETIEMCLTTDNNDIIHSNEKVVKKHQRINSSSNDIVQSEAEILQSVKMFGRNDSNDIIQRDIVDDQVQSSDSFYSVRTCSGSVRVETQCIPLAEIKPKKGVYSLFNDVCFFEKSEPVINKNLDGNNSCMDPEPYVFAFQSDLTMSPQCNQKFLDFELGTVKELDSVESKDSESQKYNVFSSKFFMA